MLFKKWDVWWAFVPLEENKNELLHRPVLVIRDTDDKDSQEIFVLSYKITSHEPRENYLGELRIVDYEEAGLPLKSTLRLSKKLLLPSKLFDEKIGKLSINDQKRVENALIELQNEQIEYLKNRNDLSKDQIKN